MAKTFEELRKEMQSNYGREVKKDPREVEPSEKSKASFNDLRKEMKEKYKIDLKVDEDFINTFLSDANNYLKGVKDTYNSIQYSTVGSVYDSQLKTVTDLRKRSGAIRQYLKANKDSIDQDAYNSFYLELRDLDDTLVKYLDSFSKAKGYYGQFKTEDDYNVAKLYSMSNDELKKYIEEQTKANFSNEDTSWWDKISNTEGIYKLSDGTVTSVKEIYDNKMLNSLLNMSTEDLKLRANDQTIAYTTSKGDDITWQQLYEQKVANEKNQEMFKNYDEALGMQGYAKYEERQAAAKQREKEELESEKLWEKIGRWLYGSTADTTTLGGTLTYAEQGYRESAKQGNEYKPAKDWTDEERYRYGYLYETGGDYRSYAYQTNLAKANASRAEQAKAISDFSTDSFWGGALSTVGSLFTSTVGGTVEYIDYLMKMNAGVDPNANFNRDLSPYEYTETVTGSISSYLNDLGQLNEDIAIVGGKGWGDVYQLGYSIGQSALMAVSGNPAATVSTFFGNAAMSGIKDAKSRGATDEQAVVLGTLYGLAEMAAEQFSIGNLKSISSAAYKGFFRNALKQGGIEASEELVTSMVNLFSDNLVMKEKSELNLLIEKYKAEGVENPEKKAWLDIAEGVAFDTLSGLISGSVSGAGGQLIGSAANKYKNSRLYGELYGDNVEAKKDLVTEALELNPDNAHAQRMQSRLDKGKNISGYQINRLVEANEQALRTQDTAKIKSSVAERLTSLGETGDVDAIATALTKQASGENLSLSEKNLIKKSKFGQRVANEISPENIKSGGYTSAWAENIGTERINAESYNKGLYDLAAEKAGVTVDEKKPSVTVDASDKEIATESKFEVSTDGKTKLGDTEVSIKEIASVKNGEVMLRLEDGSTVKASDVEYGSSEEGLIYENVAHMGLNAATANAFVKGYDGSISVADYALGFRQAYRYGELGIPKSEMNSEDFSLGLTMSQKSLAYDLGKTDAKYKASEKNEIKKAKIASTDTINADKNANKGTKKGKLHNTLKPTNETQRASLKTLRAIAEILGIDIYTFESAVVDGKRQGSNGWYDPSDNSIHIDLYAGADGKGTMLFTAAHELTHHLREKLPAKFKAFADFLFEQYGKEGVSVSELIAEKRAFLEEKGRITPDMSEQEAYDLAYEEVVADSCESFLADGEAVQKIAELKAKDHSLWQTIKDFLTNLVARIKAAYKGLSPDSVEGRYVAEMLDTAEQLKAMWTEMLVEASDVVEIDMDSKSVAPIMNSERTWTESEYVTEREETAKKIANALGVDIKTAYKYIDDINSVAKLIADDRARLDYEPNLDENATVLKPNSDYKYSVDMSTLCAKRLLFTGTFDAIQRALPNTVFDSEDIVALREMMQKRGYEVACGICYVESTRREIGRITQDFIDSYKEAQKTGKPITRINSEGKAVDLKKTKDQMGTTADKSTDKFFADKNYTPTLADLNTTDIDLVKRDHPLVYEAYLNFMNARGQAKPKLLETRAEYKGEILKHFKYKSAVNARNNAGGLRLQSFSDFEVPHLIDMMQIVMDMSRVGLKSQAYTKVPAFAEVFGDSGVKINLSLIAKGDGLDADGNLIFDDVEGIDHKKAFDLRDKFSKNVGTILVGKNDAHIIAAMADPRIDYIIPFHKSSWKESLYDALGLTGYDDYTDTQHEKPLDKSRKISDYDPSEYWDFTKTGDENAQIYLEKCREDGRIPKFPQFQGYPGYWKLLIDFKMYDNDGVGSPQEVVQPVFDMDASEKILREYKGGHKSFPVAKDVVEDFVKEYRDKGTHSDREFSKDFTNKMLDSFGIKKLSDYIHVQRQVFGTLLNEDFFTDVEKRSRIDTNEESGMVIETNKSSISETFNESNYGRLGKFKKLAKLSTVRMLPEIIKNGKLIADNIPNQYQNSANKTFAYIAYDTEADGIPITVKLDIKKSPIKNKMWVHSIITEKNSIGLDVSSKNGIGTPYRTDAIGEIISQDSDSVNTSEKKLYSDRASYAPTFYSYMGKIVDGIKLDKMGAGGVVSYLKGRGVKDEEIKWSGIEAFLEGKKSVTKAELQEFVAGSQLQIEEEMSGLNQEAYDELEALWVKHAGVSLSETFSDDFDLPLTEDNMADVFDDMEREGYDVPPLEIQRHMLELAKKAGNEGRWSKYKLPGGKNYRELVFKMPNSSYSNDAMKGHWGQDAEGVLAHARIQDFTVNGKKMLFVEEIQSDWHNAGHKFGYEGEDTEASDSGKDYKTMQTMLRLLRMKGFMEGNEAQVDEEIASLDVYAQAIRTRDMSIERTHFGGDPSEPLVYVLWHDGDAIVVEEDAIEFKSSLENELTDIRDNDLLDYAHAEIAPDAPFRTNYHEYVLKRLLRMAAEEGYDSIGWTTADIQSERWSEDYGEGYRIEYDQDIPSFLKKYGKKWGATVGKAAIAKEAVVGRERILKETELRNVKRDIERAKKELARKYDSYEKAVLQRSIDSMENTVATLEQELSASLNVWSMDITDSMKDSVLHEGQVLYSDRNTASFKGKAFWSGSVSLLDGVIEEVHTMEEAEAVDFHHSLYFSPIQVEKMENEENAFFWVDNGEVQGNWRASVPKNIIERIKEQISIDPKFSERDPNSFSNRSLLANALESVAQNDIERNKLKEYKSKITLIESEQAKLSEIRGKIKELSFATGPRDNDAIKKLRFAENQTANRINTYDRQLLNLEATTALKGVLEREKQMAYKRAEQKGKEALKMQREKDRARNAKTQRELMTRYQESRKKGIEGRKMTEMRYKIKTVVNELNQYLTKGTKDKHVPIGLQKPIAEALAAVNMDTVGAEERIAKKQAEMRVAKSLEEMQRLSKEIEHIQEMGGNMEAKLSRLKTAYDSIINSDDPLIAGSHDDVISNTISKVIEVVGDTPLRDMSLYQLEAVYDMYRMVLTSVRNANKAFKAAKNEEISVIANRVMEEIDKLGKKQKLYRTKAAQTASSFDWNNLKPVYAFERIGSSTFTEVFNAVREGEDTWARDMSEAQAFREENFKKYKYDSWDFKKRYSFTSTSGMSFELSLDQIMSLYAYSKREQAKDHLKKGGIVFDETTEVTVKTKLGIPVKFNPTQATAYNLSDETLVDIIGKLTPEQIAFVDAMQDYLSTTMGEKGNEVSLALYDVKLYKEKNYFPLKSATQFMAKAKEQQKGEVKIKNSGFSKETTPKASNPIVLTPFMDVWAGHVNEMSMYHAFVLPLEDFYRVFNYKTPTSDTMATESVEMFLQNAHGKAASAYIDQLLKDLNGGAISDPRETLGKSLMSNFKKASVMASLSVVVQQPTAIVRATALVDAKYFAGKKATKGKHKEVWAEVKKYAPVAVIKEMGYFDTGVGRGSVEWLKGEKTLMDKVDDAVSKAPSLADEVTWVAIWNAVKRETLHTHKDLRPNSEEFLKAVGERFTEVIVKTQVYDSTLSRSANMRSKGALMNMWTAFMAEPTTSINMLQSGVWQAKRGNKKYLARAMGAVYGSVVLNAALVSLVYAMRDDDEDETFLEKYLSRFTTEVIDGINPLTYIPFVKDIWSIAQGFDVERADMSLITDVINSLQAMVKVASKDTSDMDETQLAEHKKAVTEAILAITDNLSSLVGIPAKNIRRDIKGFINTFNTVKKDASGRKTTPGSLGDNILEDVKDSIPVWGWFPNESKGDKLYDAIIKGDTAYVDRLKSGYKSESAFDSAIRSALRENDPRIKEAAESAVNGDFETYNQLIEEIIDEGNFSKANIRAAVKSEINNLTEDKDETETPKDKEVSIYEIEYVYREVVDGDIVMAHAMKEDIIRTAIANGKDRDEAEKSFNNSFTSYVKNRYDDAELSDHEAKNILVSFGGKSEEDASSKVQYWAFKNEYPNYDLSEEAVKKYYNEVEPSGIDVDVYYDYYKQRGKVKGTDSDGDGKTDSGSVKSEVLKVIDSLPISSSQKDVLYFLNGWAESKLYEAPWH